MIEQHFKNIILVSGLRIKHGEGWLDGKKRNKLKSMQVKARESSDQSGRGEGDIAGLQKYFEGRFKYEGYIVNKHNSKNLTYTEEG